MTWRNEFDEPGHSQVAATNLNSHTGGDGGDGQNSGGHTKADTQAMGQAADALVGLRGSTDSVDNQADDKTLEASKFLNKHTLGASAAEGGWLTAGALVEMGVRWGDQVINLKSILQDISEKLHDTRQSYTKREIAERADYQRMHPDFG